MITEKPKRRTDKSTALLVLQEMVGELMGTYQARPQDASSGKQGILLLVAAGSKITSYLRPTFPCCCKSAITSSGAMSNPVFSAVFLRGRSKQSLALCPIAPQFLHAPWQPPTHTGFRTQRRGIFGAVHVRVSSHALHYTILPLCFAPARMTISITSSLLPREGRFSLFDHHWKWYRNAYKTTTTTTTRKEQFQFQICLPHEILLQYLQSVDQ